MNRATLLEVERSDRASPAGSLGSTRRWLCAGCLLVALLSGSALFWEYVTPARAKSVANTRNFVKKNIEDLRVDDVVLAWDEETGIVVPKKVTAVYCRVADHVRVVVIRPHGATQSQELRTTDEHPFFVKGRGWVKADELKNGYEVRQFGEEYGQVESSERHDQKKGVPVYNIETEGFHTYFVAEHGARGPPILVHNCNAPKPGLNPKGIANPPKPATQTNPKANIPQGGVAATKGDAPVRTRLPQDSNVNPVPPDPLALTRPIGQSATQNAALQAEIAAARRAGATDFRVNQQQVNAAGERVGTNRPDLQYTDANGRRVYVEYDTTSSTRGPGHQMRIEANDPNGRVILRVVD